MSVVVAESKDVGQVLAQLRDVIEIECHTLWKLRESLQDSAVQAVDILFSCRGRVLVSGMGKSGLIGRKIAATLSSTGTPAFFLHPAEAHHGDLGIASAGDVLLACSSSGETDELIQILPHCHRVGIPIIALTGRSESTLARLSTCVIEIAVAREADPLNVAPTASTTALLAMGDALAVALLVRRGFTKEQFGMFHPGGNLGRKLLLRVQDIMHTAGEVAIVPPETRLAEAICQMTEKRLGAVFVAAESTAPIEGVFTDGDLRRLLQRADFSMEASILDVMIRGPRRIRPDALAADAAKLMEDFAISILPVVNESNAVVGAIHLHDLMKAGFA